jgi:acyl carrier protein
VTETEAYLLIERALRSLLQRDINIVPGRSDQTSLRDLGVSSLKLFELVSVLESVGGFIFDDVDVDSATFSTIETLVAALCRYRLDSSPTDVDGQQGGSM